MTILAVGGEDSDFIGAGGNSINTTTTYFRSNYARCSLRVTVANQSNGWQYVYPAARSSFWATARLNFTPAGSSAGSSGYAIHFLDGAVRRLKVQSDYSGISTGKWRLTKTTSGGVDTVLQTSTTPIPVNTTTKIDVFVNYGASGGVKVYAGGVLVIDFTGDVTTDGATTLDSAMLGCIHGTTSTCDWSEFILADEDTRGMALATLTPAAAGNSQTWSGAVGDINETTLSDATLISTSSNDQLAQFTVTPASIITGSIGVRGVAVNARAAKGASGPQNLQANIRTGGTDYQSSNLPVAGSFARVGNIWAVNPNTGVAWTAADLNAAGFNIGLKSIA